VLFPRVPDALQLHTVLPGLIHQLLAIRKLLEPFAHPLDTLALDMLFGSNDSGTTSPNDTGQKDKEDIFIASDAGKHAGGTSILLTAPLRDVHPVHTFEWTDRVTSGRRVVFDIKAFLPHLGNGLK
jgi:hypothetical protein